jgi:hypothetical protein
MKITSELKEKELHYKNKLSERMTDDGKVNERLSTLEEAVKDKE